jgi:hypothetical protein
LQKKTFSVTEVRRRKTGRNRDRIEERMRIEGN